MPRCSLSMSISLRLKSAAAAAAAAATNNETSLVWCCGGDGQACSDAKIGRQVCSATGNAREQPKQEPWRL
jgi:hypothetical protein